MATWSECDLNALLLQHVPGTHDVVHAFDLMVDVLHAGPRRREERHLVMHFVDPKQGRIADAITHAGPKHLGPEPFVAFCIGRTQSHVTEAGDAGIARREVAPSTVMRANNHIDLVARWILEVDEALDVSLLAFLDRAVTNFHSGIAQLRRRGIELLRRPEFKTHGVVCRIALEIHQGVVAFVTAEVRSTRLLARPLQAKYLAREEFRLFALPRAETNVSNVEQIDHQMSPLWAAEDFRKCEDIPEMKK
jgi:hypothetical protein